MRWLSNIWRNHIGKVILALFVLAFTCDDIASRLYWSMKPPSLPPLINIQVDRDRPLQSTWVLNAYIQQQPSTKNPSIEISTTEDASNSYFGFPLLHIEQFEITYGQNRLTEETYRPDTPSLIQTDAEAIHFVFSQIDSLSSWLPTEESASVFITDGRMRRTSFMWVSFVGLCVRVVSLGLGIGLLVVLFRRDSREVKSYKWRKQGRCVECGYQLDSTLDECSECGTKRVRL